MSNTSSRRYTRAPAVPVQTAVQPSGAKRAITYGSLLLLCLAYGLFFGWLSLERYWAYEMHAQDMGNMGQAAWNTVHGHPFYFTNIRLPYHIEAWNTTTRLSFHVEALFPTISLIYLLYPHPESLLILQTIALTLGAIPVFLLARDVLGRAGWGLVFVLLYFLFPSLEALNLYEFHAVSLATPLLLFAFLFLERKQTLPFVLCALAAMGTKEEIGLVVAMFGFYAWLIRRQRRLGIAVVAVGVVWSLFATLVIEHHFRHAPTFTYVQSRYSYVGHGLHGLFHTVTHDPGVFLRVLFIGPKLAYLERLLAPVGYIALLAPVALALGLPTLALNLFSQDPHMYSALGDNSAELVAVAMIGAILGTRFVLRLSQPVLPRGAAAALVALYLLAQALWSQHLTGFTPLGSAFQRPIIGRHQHVEDRFVAMIPAGVPVSTQDELDPHLSSRHYLYLFNDTGRTGSGVSPANFVLLDVSGPTYPLPSNQLYLDAQQLLHRGWGIVTGDDGLILLRKGTRRRTPPSRFYRFVWADSQRPPVRLHASFGAFDVLGYGVKRTDEPNYVTPNLAYTVYLRPRQRRGLAYEPVVYATQGTHLIGCAAHPLGLAWYPTTRWRPNHTYAVHLDTLESRTENTGVIRLRMELIPVPSVAQEAAWATPGVCQVLWSRHGSLVGVGSMNPGP